MTKAEMRLLLAKLSPRPPEPVGRWGSALKNIVGPAILLLVGFLFGLITELFKEASAEEKLLFEHRTKVFISASEHFEAYRLNWSRLIDFAHWQWEQSKKGQALSPPELERRNKYVAARDSSKEQLFSQFRAARLFFSDEVGNRIDKFRAFDAEQSSKTIDKLAPIASWDAHQNSILEQMRLEVRKK